ncbi:MAG: DUF2071 domain-containing protein [Chthoniobacterales bacterium]
MHSTISTVDPLSPSEAGKRRLLSRFGEPLFLARWDRAVFINYSADPAILQPQVPFELDLRDGRAFVSVVAFTLVRMRPWSGGAWTEWLLKPIATHEFLNIRTYVRHNGEPGIFFLAEWLSNRISVLLGPRTFGLPYRFGALHYKHRGAFQGSVRAAEGELIYSGEIADAEFGPCAPGSLDEFMLERYTAFTQRGKRRRLFRIWHPPWPQASAICDVDETSLIASTGSWWNTAEFVSANYSPGADVWMGRPHRIRD